MPVVYFKTGAAEPVGLRCTRDGKIDFSKLGREFKLDPTSIKLNGILCPKVGPLSEDTWEQIKADFKEEEKPVGKKDDPVIVTGEAAVPAVSTEGEPSAKRSRTLAEDFMGKKIQMVFDAKECDMRDWKSGVVETTGMNEVMKSFADFPAQYYVRIEDSYTEIKVSRLNEMAHICTRLRAQYPGLLFFVDGFTYIEVQQNHEDLSPYALLATSSQFVPKRDDPTERILLPAWQFDALSDFAVKTKMFEKGETAKEVFYYSGGSLRDFCTNLEKLKRTVELDLTEVRDGKQGIMLMGVYGGAHLDQVDRIRRTYVANPEVSDSYKKAGTLLVDSRYVLQGLIQRCDVAQYEELYNVSKVGGGALYGLAFEMYLHKLATGNGFKIQARAYDPSTALGNPVEIRIKASNSTREGSKESLRRWCLADSQYWYPDYAMFPNLDSVAKPVQPCPIQVAYIQMTVSDTHKLNREWLEELDDKIFRSFSGTKAYIAILPPETKKFRLTPQNPTTVPPQNPTTVPPQNPTTVPLQNPTTVPLQNPTTVPLQNPTTVPLQNPTTVPLQNPTTVPLYVAYFDGALGPNPE